MLHILLYYSTRYVDGVMRRQVIFKKNEGFDVAYIQTYEGAERQDDTYIAMEEDVLRKNYPNEADMILKRYKHWKTRPRATAYNLDPRIPNEKYDGYKGRKKGKA